MPKLIKDINKEIKFIYGEIDLIDKGITHVLSIIELDRPDYRQLNNDLTDMVALKDKLIIQAISLIKVKNDGTK